MKAVLPPYVEIVATASGAYMVLAKGTQWGPPGAKRDSSGAAANEWPTVAEAIAAFMDAEATYRTGG